MIEAGSPSLQTGRGGKLGTDRQPTGYPHQRTGLPLQTPTGGWSQNHRVKEAPALPRGFFFVGFNSERNSGHALSRLQQQNQLLSRSRTTGASYIPG
jgi:hypothetical protein